ncbi:MAG: sugar phosphate nucleotidyltransferase [Candidatus Roizmanbacteria bacterium]|nr:sugar phosphate nucleotidyltransferase [Candidatus Roizmanbacteria bacterium]
MKAVIFAGGAGTRLWPLSRKHSPKQFEDIVGDQSTLQLAVKRLYPAFKPEDIYISTNKLYKDIVKKQLPDIPEANLIFEPAKRDVGPAVAFVMGKLLKDGIDEPVVILWSDHLVKQEDLFKSILKKASDYLEQGSAKIVFVAHKPRFASEQLGWIHYNGEVAQQDGTSLYGFEGFKYKPDAQTAKQFFESGTYAWNLGYFATTPRFIYDAFKKFEPSVYEKVETILKAYGTDSFEQILQEVYTGIESVSFDNAILERLQKEDAAIIVEDLGWSDVGAWDALKEAIEESPQANVTRGNTIIKDSQDTLLYNYEDGKLVVGIDLDGMIVVNTGDVLLVTKKTSIAKVKKLVESFEGTEHEKLT